MKINKILIAAFIGSVLFSSCKKVLDKVDENKGNSGLIFGDSTLVKQNMDYIYDQNLPKWFGNDGGAVSSQVTTLTDESASSSVSKFLQGSLANSDIGDIGTATNNTGNYAKIRIINVFIRDCGAGTLAAATKNRFLGQAYFFRAFRYFSMVRVYGGVPLVLTPISSVGDDARTADLLPRNKTSECIKQIANDLDTAIKYLPVKWPNTADWGRITSGAAAAFKSRVLLTWASPQFNPTDDKTRWQAAYDASTQAVDLLTKGNFGLFTSTATSAATGSTNPYQNMWFTEVNNPEAVMVTGFNTATGDQTKDPNGYDASVRPSYLGGSGGSSQPTWNFVKLYPMKDGKNPGDPTSAYTYSDQKFWKNRDPRFNATIAYNGAVWPTQGVTNYKLWTYLYYTNSGNTNSKSTEISGRTTSGFYLRKATDATANATSLLYSGTDWMEIRYAEVLLNQAEAAAELATPNNALAYDNLKAIRARAQVEKGADNMYGLTPGLTGTPLINAIMLERAIEFAYEGKRFWDLQRRNLVGPLLNTISKRVGIVITLKNPGSNNDYIASTRDAANLDDLYDNTFNQINTTNKSFVSLDDVYKTGIAWDQTKYSFFPIPPATIVNDPNIHQNVAWGGDFDPLQ